MFKTRLFLFGVIVFYLSNMAIPAVNSFLIIWKWSILLFLLFVFYTQTTFRERTVVFFPDHIYLALGIMLVYAISITYLSTNEFKGIYKILGMVFVLLLASKLSKYFMLKENNIDFCKILIIVGALVIYSSLLLYLFGINMGRGAGELRFSGWVDNPNTLGMMLLPIYPVLLLFSLKINKITVFSPRVLLVLSVIVVLMTGSRASAAALAIATLIIVSFQEGGKIKLTIMVLLSVLFITLIGLELQDFLDQLGSFGRSEKLLLSGREEVWGLAIMLIQQNPYFGYGFDTEVSLISQYSYLIPDHQGKVFHNSYLSYVVHLGLFGSIPLVWLMLVSLKNLITIKSNSRSMNELHMKVVGGAIVMSSFVHAIFETWIFSPGNLVTLIFWVALFNLNCRIRLTIAKT